MGGLAKLLRVPTPADRGPGQPCHELAADLAATSPIIPAVADGEGQAAEVEPPTGWEGELGELAHHLIRLACVIATNARDHQAVAADWRHAARTAGIRRSPAPKPRRATKPPLAGSPSTIWLGVFLNTSPAPGNGPPPA
ncbi:hypothetical protein AB0I56_45845 [Nonomuraea africana]|uniref:hypothetical protein n=1 Tax=Nonomuraea africana TaxID=46171 RepID=UPI0033CF1341